MFTGYDHSTLYINNIGRGPPGDKNTILDYDDLSEEEGHTWILPCPNTQLLGKCYLNRPLVKRAYQKINFLISQPKHMLWVLKRTVSMRGFF